MAELKKAICPACGGVTVNGRHYTDRGRRITLTDKQIEAILRNYLSADGVTGKDFCKASGWVKPMTYSNIIRLTIKNPADRERIHRIAASLGYKHNGGGGSWVKISKESVNLKGGK